MTSSDPSMNIILESIDEKIVDNKYEIEKIKDEMFRYEIQLQEKILNKKQSRADKGFKYKYLKLLNKTE
jgi:small nuclear ribonucleoprotein (snRNP)-like protein